MSRAKTKSVQLSRHELSVVREAISSEGDLQKYVKAGMETEGWDVIREMSPDHSNKRADLVCIHPKFGRLGIETKYRTDGSLGSHVAKAIRQILEYSKKKYLGDEIDLWAVGLYGNTLELIDERIEDDKEKRQRKWERSLKMRELQRIANGFGIGWLDLSRDRVVVEFAADTPTYRVPLFTLEDRGWPYWYTENGEFDKHTVVQKVGERWLTE